MALGNTLPFGLRDVKLKSINAAGALGTGVDLPVSRTFSFADTEDFEELRGDDQVVASHGSGPTVEWDLEGGGISLDAYAIMAGGSVTTTGTTPNQKKTYSKLITDARPYFFVEGQAISDSGGDFHTVVYYCKADGNLEGELGDGQFWLTSASGKGYANSAGKVYDFVQNETVSAIV
jgi:hypothetical protein